MLSVYETTAIESCAKVEALEKLKVDLENDQSVLEATIENDHEQVRDLNGDKQAISNDIQAT